MESDSRPHSTTARAGRPRASNLLVRASRPDDALPYLDPSSPVSSTAASVLVVSFENSSSDVADAWRQTTDHLPPNFAIVDVVDGLKNRSPEPTTIRSRGHSVTRVSREDLSGLGATVAETLSRWDDPEPVLCFDSISSLIRAAGFELSLRFLQALTRTVRDLDATAYYYVDPAADADRTDEVLKHLFDDVVEHTVESTDDAESDFDRLKREFTSSELRCNRCGHVDDEGNWQVKSGSERGSEYIRYQRTCPECGTLATKDVKL